MALASHLDLGVVRGCEMAKTDFCVYWESKREGEKRETKEVKYLVKEEIGNCLFF